MANKPTFFEFAAQVGLTKHLGGMEATEELARLCHFSPGKTILDVGCGVGVTPVFIAKKYNCKVVGVDILEGMAARSRQRAKKEGVQDKVTFKVADAQDLPFEDDTFDAVITESVTALVKNQQLAVNEYVRVTKPNGFVGLNESTWLKHPPPPELVTWVSQADNTSGKPLIPDEWSELLQAAQLQDIVVKTYTIEVQDEAKNIHQRYGLGGMLGVFARMLRLYIRNKDYRQFVKGVQQGGITPENLDEYFGYGLFVGQKM